MLMMPLKAANASSSKLASKESIHNSSAVLSNDSINYNQKLKNTTTTTSTNTGSTTTNTISTTNTLNDLTILKERKNECYDGCLFLMARIEMILKIIPKIYIDKYDENTSYLVYSKHSKFDKNILLKTFIIFEIIQNGALFRYKEIHSIITSMKLVDENLIYSKQQQWSNSLNIRDTIETKYTDILISDHDLPQKKDLVNSTSVIEPDNCFGSNINISKGGNAQVFKGLYLGKKVALKLFNIYDLMHLKELASVAALKDLKYSVKTYGVVKIDGSYYLVMDMCEYTLGSAMKKRKIKIGNYAEFFYICKAIVICIDKIHLIGFLHRDIKSSNILIKRRANSQKFDILICDFGLTRKFGSHSNGDGYGTANYMSPELNSDKASIKSDIYSIGIVFWEVLHYFLFGRSVNLNTSNIMDRFICLKKTVNGYRPPIPSCVDKSIYDLLSRMWATKPTNRPTIPEILQSLESIESKYNKNKKAWDDNIPGPKCSFNNNFILSSRPYKAQPNN